MENLTEIHLTENCKTRISGQSAWSDGSHCLELFLVEIVRQRTILQVIICLCVIIKMLHVPCCVTPPFRASSFVGHEPSCTRLILWSIRLPLYTHPARMKTCSRNEQHVLVQHHVRTMLLAPPHYTKKSQIIQYGTRSAWLVELHKKGCLNCQLIVKN